VSIGNKADVSSNDLLEYWEDDPSTELVLLYLESFGNPRKFGRLARRVARKKPILAMKGGRSRAGARAAGSHTAALAGSEAAADASGADKPLLAVFVSAGGPPPVLLAGPRPIAVFSYPESAARALGRAAERAEWLRRPAGTVPELTGIERRRAEELVRPLLEA